MTGSSGAGVRRYNSRVASPVGHISVGLAAGAVLARATGTPDSAALWGAVAIASMIPDFDVALTAVGFPKRFHRSVTHSLPFVLAVIGAGVAFQRMSGFHVEAGFTLAWIAALASHPFLDVVTSGPTIGRLGWGIPLFWPFSGRRFWVRRPLFVGDRGESNRLVDTMREMAEDARWITPWCVGVILITRLLPAPW